MLSRRLGRGALGTFHVACDSFAMRQDQEVFFFKSKANRQLCDRPKIPSRTQIYLWRSSCLPATYEASVALGQDDFHSAAEEQLHRNRSRHKAGPASSCSQGASESNAAMCWDAHADVEQPDSLSVSPIALLKSHCTAVGASDISGLIADENTIFAGRDSRQAWWHTRKESG